MKRNIFIIASLVLVSFTACKKFLDTKPDAFLQPAEYYKGANLTNALAGIYNPLSFYNMFTSGIFVCNDETFYGGPGRNVAPNNASAFGYDYTTANIATLWGNCYRGIERANELLTYVNPDDASADANAAYGEALFLRGFYHFMLVSNFGDVPLKLKPTTSPEGLNVDRTPSETVYKQVLADMKAAEGRVYEITKFGHASRVSKSAVQGILARVYLKMAGYPLNGGAAGSAAMYDSARTYCRKVMNSGLHSLNPSYGQVFINHAANTFELKESIWELDVSGNTSSVPRIDGQFGIQNGILYQPTGQLLADSGYSWGFAYVNKALYDKYDVYDARRDWNVANFTYGVDNARVTLTRNPISNSRPFEYNRNNAKWRRTFENFFPKDRFTSSVSFGILRYSDVLLMFAEADLQLNGGTSTVDGIAAVNAVRRRGYGLTATTAPLKSLTITNEGSGYNTTVISNYNNASIANINLGNWLGCASTITGGKVTAVTLTSGGLGFTAASAATIYLGTLWTANTVLAVNKQVISNGNLYTVTTAGTTTSTAPTHTSGASNAIATGAVFTYAGTVATASGTLLTQADVDLSSVTLQTIQDERARELCYEALRRHDLIRWNIFHPTMVTVYNQMNNWASYATNTKANAIVGYNNVLISDPKKFLLLPIPASEMSVNENMKQNFGW
jgi:hypothetical protein